MNVSARPELVTLASGVYAWIGAAGDSNAGAIDTPDGLLVIDAQQHLRLAQEFRAALTSATRRPVRELINTHCHLDHTAGNAVFRDVPILAHAATLAALEAGLGPRPDEGWSITDWPTKVRMLFGPNSLDLVPPHDPARAWFERRVSAPDYDTILVRPPDRTFADRFAYHFAGREVRLDYFGPAHCDGDVTVRLVQERIIFLGDLFFHGRFPWLGDCDLDGWIDALGRILALDVAVIVPGHGPPATARELKEFRDLLIVIRDAVAGALAAGVSEDAAVHEIELPRYVEMPRYREWKPFNVRAAYRYLRAR